MGLSPWYVGNLAPAWKLQLIPDTSVVNVTGLVVGNFSLRIRNLDTPGTETTGQGTFSNITAATTITLPSGQVLVTNPASVQYQLVIGDVNKGRYELWLDVTFSNGVQSFLIQELWQVVSE